MIFHRTRAMLLRCHLFSSFDALNGVPTHAYRDNARFASDLPQWLSRPSKVHSPALPLPRSHPPQLSEAFCPGYYSFSSVCYIGLMIVPFPPFVNPPFSPLCHIPCKSPLSRDRGLVFVMQLCRSVPAWPVPAPAPMPFAPAIRWCRSNRGCTCRNNPIWGSDRDAR